MMWKLKLKRHDDEFAIVYICVSECVDELRAPYVYFVRSLLLQLHSLQLLQLPQLLLLLLLLLSLHKLLKPQCGTRRV